MKKLMFLILMLFSIHTYSQTMYEKYNSYNNRYEYFDTYGNMIGHKFYDSYKQAWVYQKYQQQNNDMNLTDVARYSGNTQAQLQSRYDYNLNRINIFMKALINKVNTSSLSEVAKQKCIKDFVEKCVNPLDAKKLNMTDIALTTQAINWLNQSMENIINFYSKQ